MSLKINEGGIAICTYNRAKYLGEVIQAVQETAKDCKIVVCDDGSKDDTPYVIANFPDILYVRGPNKGVAYNKNRALFALQNCNYICILEDDLVPVQSGWFDIYKKASEISGIHHFCRVQDKEVEETLPEFSEYMAQNNLTPIYGPSPRGDFTFLTRAIFHTVGGFNPAFIGAGYAHGEWSNRVVNAGLVGHPLKWVDIREGRDSFEQRGDTEGGRWLEDKAAIKEQIKRNRAIQRKLKASKYLYSELDLL